MAAELAATLHGGEVIALVGDLGAGKTTFVQGLCEALGVKSRVTSPTFAILNVHKADGLTLKITHLDLYRIKSAREIVALGLEEFLGAPDTVTVIEWPDVVDGVQWNPTITVSLRTLSSQERDIIIAYANEGGLLSAKHA